MKKFSWAALGLNSLGFLSYVGMPIIPVSLYWDLLVHKNAKTTLSTITLLVLVSSFSVFKFIFTNKSPIKLNNIWVILFAVTFLLKPIIDKLLIVSIFGILGSVCGSTMFYKAKQIKEGKKQEEHDKKILAAIKGAL